MKKKSAGSRVAVAVLCVSLAAGSIPAAAAPRVPEDMSQEAYDKLQDDCIEWDEISDLIEYYSPMYADLKAITKENTLTDMETVRAAWQTEIDDLSWQEENLKDDLKRATNPLQIQQLTIELYTVQGTKSAYQQVRTGVRKAAEQAEKTIDRSFQANKPQILNGMQQAFLGAKQLEQAMAISQKQVELYQATYNTQKTSVETGLATEAQLLSAQYDLEQAQSQLAELQLQLDQVKNTIGLMLGWKAEGTAAISFGAFPAYDLNYLEGRNLDADIEQAAVHNKQLGEAKRETAHNSYEKNIKETNLELTETKIRMEMETMYHAIEEARLNYDAAQAGLEAARLSREGAERKKALGLVGNAEYQGLQLQYVAKEAQANMAQMAYYQAVFAYDWAMQGILTVS